MMRGALRAACRVLPPAAAGQVRVRAFPQDEAVAAPEVRTGQSANGARFVGSTDDFLSHQMLLHGYFDWRNWAVAQVLVPPGGTIVEVGANVGTETVCFGAVVGAQGRVVAFEPVAANLEWLTRNRELNADLPIQIEPIGLSDRTGDLTFEEPPRDISGEGWLVSEDDDEGPRPGWTRTVVPVRRFDDLELGLERLDYMTLDVEGAEPAVLLGATESLRRFRPAVVVEADRHHLRRAGYAGGLVHLRDVLVDLDYEPFVIERFDLIPFDPAAPPHHRNWLALPRERVDEVARVRRHLRRCFVSPVVFGLNPLARTNRPRR
ncbi:MAG TPA: FkbM family methyltransferase [Acidimicrobiales bacterium]|jgi:FkbM family methyltransferase